jgi:hypothetical protein
MTLGYLGRGHAAPTTNELDKGEKDLDASSRRSSEMARN